jgi:hypothetical protein
MKLLKEPTNRNKRIMETINSFPELSDAQKIIFWNSDEIKNPKYNHNTFGGKMVMGTDKIN